MAKKKDDTVRDSIIETSIRLFLAKGFVGTSVIEISKAVGIAKGTVYCHFESKEQILDSILDKYAKEFLDGVIEEVNRCEGDFLRRFKAFYKYTTEFGRDHRELMLVWHTLLGEIIGNSSATERKMKDIQARYARFLETLLGEGKKEGMIGDKIDTHIHARIIMATLTGMLLQWYIESPPTADDNKVYVRAFREAILKGMETPRQEREKRHE